MNQDLKEIIEQVSVEPSADVWMRVRKTMRHKMMVRRAAVSAAVVVLAAGIGVVLWGIPAHDDVKSASVDNGRLAAIEQYSAVVADSASVEPDEVVSPEVSNDLPKPQVAIRNDAVSLVSETPVVNVATSMAVPQTDQVASVPAHVAIVDEKPSVKASSQHVEVALPTSQAPASEQVVETPSVDAVSDDESWYVDETPMDAGDVEKGQEDDAAAEEAMLLVPNFFAPDGDVEENRVFRVRTVNNVTLTNFSMYIYDRRGQKVMQTKDMNESWDGSYQSRRMPQGAYVYVINYIDVNGEPRSKRGTVTLIR